jgi:hypothetical protein
MHVQVITFKLDGIDDAAYQAHAEQNAPAFAALPGLRAKIWLANQQTNTYGGIYTWDDVAAMRPRSPPSPAGTSQPGPSP